MTEEKYLNNVTPDMALLCVSMKLYQTITQRNHSSPLCIGQVDKFSQHKFERTVFWLPRWVVVGLVPSSTSFFPPTHSTYTHTYQNTNLPLKSTFHSSFICLLPLHVTLHELNLDNKKLLDTNYVLYTIRINDLVRHTRIWIRHFVHVIACYMKKYYYII